MAIKVVHLVKNAEPESTAQARIVKCLAQGLPRDRYEVHCCFLSRNGPLVQELADGGVKVHLVPWYNRKDVGGALRFLRFLQRHGFSILHQHFGGASIRLLARAAGVCTVLHVHSRILENRGLAPVQQKTRFADAVIATSLAVAGCIRSRIPIRVIYPAVELASDENCRVASGRVIGTAARLVPVKGITYLLRAVALLRQTIPDIRLQIAGAGPSKGELEAEVKALAVEASVEFLGWQADLRQYFRSWSVFVLPSIEEAFGLAALEAMAAGVPVVASRVGGLPELVNHGINGMLVAPADPRALSERIGELLQDDSLRQSMSAAARQRTRTCFSTEQMLLAVSQTYACVLASRSCLETSCVIEGSSTAN